MKSKLSVNLNKVALIRNSRGQNYPNLWEFACLCLKSGAHGITLHPRPDQRHATYADVREMINLKDQFPEMELNIEGYPSGKFLEIVLDIKPDQCTLVPDEPVQLTSDHGWDIDENRSLLSEVTEQLSAAGIRVSVFSNPNPESIAACAGLEIDRVELYTADYAKAFSEHRWAPVLAEYKAAAAKAREMGLEINAGHDLNLLNLKQILLAIPDIKEVSIGHALVVESLEFGMQNVIQKYLSICGEDE